MARLGILQKIRKRETTMLGLSEVHLTVPEEKYRGRTSSIVAGWD